jgi:hypothetical protein
MDHSFLRTATSVGEGREPFVVPSAPPNLEADTRPLLVSEERNERE